MSSPINQAASQQAAMRQIEENKPAYQQQQIKEIQQYFAQNLNNPFDPSYNRNLDRLIAFSTQSASPELAALVETVLGVYSNAGVGNTVSTQQAAQPIPAAAQKETSRKRSSETVEKKRTSAAAEKRAKELTKLKRVDVKQLNSIKDILEKDPARGFTLLTDFTERFPENEEAAKMLTDLTTPKGSVVQTPAPAPTPASAPNNVTQDYDNLCKANWEKEKALTDQIESFTSQSEGFKPTIGTAAPSYQLFKISMADALFYFEKVNISEMTKAFTLETGSEALNHTKQLIFSEFLEKIKSEEALGTPEQVDKLKQLISEVMRRTLNLYNHTKAPKDATPEIIQNCMDAENTRHKSRMTMLTVQLKKIQSLAK